MVAYSVRYAVSVLVMKDSATTGKETEKETGR